MQSEETFLVCTILSFNYIRVFWIFSLYLQPCSIFPFSSFLLWSSSWRKQSSLHPLPLYFLSSLWLRGYAPYSSSALHLCHQQLHQSPVWCEVRHLHTNGAGTGCLSGRPAQWGHRENIRQHHSASQHHMIALDWNCLSRNTSIFSVENWKYIITM